MNKTYKLLVPLPDANAGSIAEWDEKHNSYRIEKSSWVVPHIHIWLTRGQVENSPEWFQLVEPERIEVTRICKTFENTPPLESKYCFYANGKILYDKFHSIESAIEAIANGEKLYTEQQLIEAKRDAFNALRMNDNDHAYKLFYPTFLDYENQNKNQ